MHASPADTEVQFEALAGGQPAAFEQFYQDHHARIYNLAARIVGDPDDAADITQEVFLRAYTHPLQAGGDLRPEPWLYRIAVNASYDHLRRRAARPSTSLDAVAEIPDTSDGFIDGEIAHCVEACLASLTPRYRTALVLKDLHGLSHAEIAEVMDIHQGAARVLLHRARAAFRRAFRSTAPTGAGGITTLGLAAFLPELPVPASLQAPPFLHLVPPATGPAGPPPDLAGPITGGGQTALSGGAPAAAVPLAAAPLAPVGLLAGLGGATGIKVAIAVIAAVAATGGGLAARQSADTPTSLAAAANRAATGAVTSSLAVPAGGPSTHREMVRERLRLGGLASQGAQGSGGAGATSRNGDGATARSGAGPGGSGAGSSGAGTGGSIAGGANSGGSGSGGTSQGGTQGGTGGSAGTGSTTGTGGTGGTAAGDAAGGGTGATGGTATGYNTGTGPGTGSGDPSAGGAGSGTGTGGG